MPMLSPGGDLFLLSVLFLLGALGLAMLWRARGRGVALKKPGARKDTLENLDTVQAWPPESTRVLSNSVLQAHKLLRMALPEHLVLAQMSLSRFLKVPTRYSYAEWMRRAGGLCVDLLICDTDAKVLAVVEIRPSAECQSDKVIKRQERMDRVLAAANIPVHVWIEGQLPSPAAARNAILGATVAFTTRTGATLVDVDAPESQPDGIAEPHSNPPVSAWFETSRSGGVEVLDRPRARTPQGSAVRVA